MPDPWFRKTFLLRAAPARAVIYVASIGYHELYVNGRKVGDQVLAPCATNHRHRARYVTYDIGHYLKAGPNVLGLWLGVSWSIFPQYQTEDRPRSPLVLAQADIRLPDGSTLRVVTDETWKTHPTPNTLLGVWDFMDFGGESYDAGRELPGWCDASLDDSAWKAASVFHPRLTLSAQKTEPNRLLKKLRPIALRQTTNGVWRLDMGVNYAGWFEMQLVGQPGDRIEFAFSEREDRPMTHRLHSAYIIGPSGKGTFRNHFNYGVGRWVEIRGLRQEPQLAQARGWLVRTDYSKGGRLRLRPTPPERHLSNNALDVREPEPRRLRRGLPPARADGIRRRRPRHNPHGAQQLQPGRLPTASGSRTGATCRAPTRQPPLYGPYLLGRRRPGLERFLHHPALGDLPRATATTHPP